MNSIVCVDKIVDYTEQVLKPRIFNANWAVFEISIQANRLQGVSNG